MFLLFVILSALTDRLLLSPMIDVSYVLLDHGAECLLI
jgi:hypothetical protein